MKDFINSLRTPFYSLVIVPIIIFWYVYMTWNIYMSDAYIDYNKPRNMEFVVIDKIHEQGGYKHYGRMLLICKNKEDNKLVTINVTPQTYATSKNGDNVNFYISKYELNRSSETNVYTPPISELFSMLITISSIIVGFLCAINFTEENRIYAAKVYCVCVLVIPASYMLFLLIRNILIFN